MRRLIAAELRKLTTTRTSRTLILAALVLAAVITAATISNGARGTGAHTLGSTAGLRAVLNSAVTAGLVSLILGVVGFAGERRWGTEVTTFLITPRRERVIVAKLIVAALVGALVGLGCDLVTVAVAKPLLAGHGVHLDPLSSTSLQVLGGVVLVSALYGAVGVGVGALIPNQPLAIGAALLWSLLVENAVLALWGAGGRWLPGGASASLTHATLPYGGTLLAPGVALALLAAYAVAFAVAGALRTNRRAVA
jgi:ABC-2 type transport system permease protein